MTQACKETAADGQTNKNILNLAGYLFVDLPESELPELRHQLKQRAIALHLKGTILLATEGINLYMAGTEQEMRSFVAFLRQDFPYFKEMTYKSSWSEYRPYTRMLVRLKNETISFGVDTVKPLQKTAAHLPPETLKEWYKNGKDMLVLDTRNDYEVQLGSFKNAVDFNIRTFKEFIAKVDAMDESLKDKPVVTFCTGGIRCEKAAEYMQQQGFSDVYQLDGGILSYFEKCGGEFYDGDCFVFDKRVAVNPSLEVTDAQVCYSCRMPLLPGEFDPEEVKCPLCLKSRFGKGNFALHHQEETIKQAETS